MCCCGAQRFRSHLTALLNLFTRLLRWLALMARVMMILAATLCFLVHDGRAAVVESVRRVVNNAISSTVFPGAVVAYGTAKDGIVGIEAFGNYTYGHELPPAPGGINPPVVEDTRFDLASLSKVIGATSAAAQFYQRGELALEELVCSDRLLGPAYGNNGKSVVTVEQLLTHSAGEAGNHCKNASNSQCQAPRIAVIAL